MLIIAAFAFAFWKELRPPPHPTHLAWAPCAAALAAIAACQCLAWLAARSMDKGRMRLHNAAHRSCLIGAALVTFAIGAGVQWWGWDALVRQWCGDVLLVDELLIASPLLATILANWWSLAPLERRVHDALFHRQVLLGRATPGPTSRLAHVLDRARAELLLVLAPMIVLMAWHEAAPWLARVAMRAIGGQHPASLLGVPASEVVRWLGLPVVVVLAPGFLRWAWRATPLGDGPTRDLILAMLARARVRVSGPLVWHTGSVNAEVLGVAPPLRYLLVTDALLERLTPRELESVVAHEIGHVKRHHLAWLACAMLAMVLALGWLVELSALARDLASVSAVALATLALALAWFGLVSRRFEWEADAYSAQAVSPGGSITAEGARIAAGTLLVVARENLAPPNRFSWRHGSIASRCDRLMALADPGPRGVAERARLRREGWAIRAFAITVPALTLVATLVR